MSNYTKLIAYDTKDGLTTGDPLKRIKGTELDDEFDAISTAIATKSNSASPEFTGTPTVPTASAGTSTTQAASTAFVQAALNALYPVGSIYTNATSATNPATLLGFGTWSAFGAGRVLIGNGGGFSAGATGGSADAITVSHSHSITDPGHQHNIIGSAATSNTGPVFNMTNGFSTVPPVSAGQALAQAAATGITATNSTGSSGTNANLQPYIVVYMWQRTA